MDRTIHKKSKEVDIDKKDKKSVPGGEQEVSIDKKKKKSISFSLDTKNILISGLVMGILAIVAGLLVLVLPDLLRWIIGIFLIVWGILAIVNKK